MRRLVMTCALVLLALTSSWLAAKTPKVPRVQGKVTGPDTKALVTAVLKLVPVTPSMPPVPWWKLDKLDGAGVDTKGRFDLEAEKPGRYILTISAPGHQAVAHLVTFKKATSRVKLTVRLERGTTLGGKVVDEKGDPVEGARVSIGAHWEGESQAIPMEGPRDSWGVESGSDGSFEIDTLPSGIYDLLVMAAGKASGRANGIKSGTTDVEIVLPDGKPIGGWVRYPDGTPAAREFVCVKRGKRIVFGMATDEKGRFRTGLISPGRYRVAVIPARRHPWGSRHPDAPVCGTEIVENVEAGKIDLVIDLRLALTISGTVVDQNGQPVKQAGVSARPTVDRGILDEGGSATTNGEGQFVIGGLAEGDYDLEVRADGMVRERGKRTVFHAKAGDRDVKIAIKLSR
jgi:Carboxypeptidase regulatory-like domain